MFSLYTITSDQFYFYLNQRQMGSYTEIMRLPICHRDINDVISLFRSKEYVMTGQRAFEYALKNSKPLTKY